MPLYYFHIRDGERLVLDESGVELPNIDAVLQEARRTIAGFLFDAALSDDDLQGEAFEVVAADGTPVLTVRFDQLLRRRDEASSFAVRPQPRNGCRATS